MGLVVEAPPSEEPYNPEVTLTGVVGEHRRSAMVALPSIGLRPDPEQQHPSPPYTTNVEATVTPPTARVNVL